MSPYQICRRQRMEEKIILVGTSNIEHRTSNTERHGVPYLNTSMFGVRCSMFDVRSSLNAIPMPPPRRDKLRAEFLAEVRHVDVEQVGHRAVVFVEEMLVKRRARDEFAAMQREVFKQRVLAGGQRHGFAGAGDRAG